jgi:hypothetical protein
MVIAQEHQRMRLVIVEWSLANQLKTRAYTIMPFVWCLGWVVGCDWSPSLGPAADLLSYQVDPRPIIRRHLSKDARELAYHIRCRLYLGGAPIPASKSRVCGISCGMVVVIFYNEETHAE